MLGAVGLIVGLIAITGSTASGGSDFFAPGNLVVSRSVYDGNSANVTVGQQLPPGCTAPNCVSAVADGTYPTVFNNDGPDSSFGITSKIFLD
ncbi:MAG TPA: hypothetical protein VGH92_01410, partial [Gaiellaceae bacterium]